MNANFIQRNEDSYATGITILCVLEDITFGQYENIKKGNLTCILNIPRGP